ncbi:MAG: nucleoside hydrolase [Firmicutes bacterium]|nr:nucleoside hydrolase [Bacillota bacterium]
MSKPRLILLCDYGLDDAVATVYLLNRKEMFDGIDILAVAGNTPESHCYKNAKILLSNFFEGIDIPESIRLVDTSCIKQECAMLPSVHGNDGMGDLLSLKPCAVTELKYNDWLKDIKAYKGQITLVSLGPCTVTKILLEAITPTTFLIMGGLAKAKPNHEGYEFNHYLDKPAFEYCAGRSDAITATLDTCRHDRFNLAEYPKPETSLINSLINRAIKLAVARHPDNCYIYDYITVHYLTHPKCFDIVKTKAQDVTLNQLELKESSPLEI